MLFILNINEIEGYKSSIDVAKEAKYSISFFTIKEDNKGIYIPIIYSTDK